MDGTTLTLVSAAGLEEQGILPKGTAYRMARIGQIPSYFVGTKSRGVRFRVEEVLEALRRPERTQAMSKTNSKTLGRLQPEDRASRRLQKRR